MSSYSRRRRSRLAVIALTLSLSLGGCGFRPLYQKPDQSDGVATHLAQIKVATIPDRTGQKLHNFLLDRLTPRGAPLQPRYVLDVTTQITRVDTGIERDETATRAILTLVAYFRLLDAGTQEVLHAGSTRSTNSFNIVAADFATMSAEIDATERAAREVSDQIRLRLALYFNRQPAI